MSNSKNAAAIQGMEAQSNAKAANAANEIQASLEAEFMKSQMEAGILKEIPRKGSSGGSSLYEIDGFNDLDRGMKSQIRNKIRGRLEYFRNEILGKDRSFAEKEEAIKGFMKLFKDGGKIEYRGKEYSYRYIAKSLSPAAIYEGGNPSYRKDLEAMISSIAKYQEIKAKLQAK